MDKEIKINIEKLVQSKLSVEEYCILYLIMLKDFVSLRTLCSHYNYSDGYFSIIAKKLEYESWLKITGNNIYTDLDIRQEFIELVSKGKIEKNIADVVNWIDEYRMLFRGKKQGAMGDPNACLLKMQKFIKTYPQFTKEQILKATALYIESNSPRYTYLQQADYFISKQGGNDKIATSRLLTYLEDIDTSVSDSDSMTQA